MSPRPAAAPQRTALVATVTAAYHDDLPPHQVMARSVSAAFIVSQHTRDVVGDDTTNTTSGLFK